MKPLVKEISAVYPTGLAIITVVIYCTFGQTGDKIWCEIVQKL